MFDTMHLGSSDLVPMQSDVIKLFGNNDPVENVIMRFDIIPSPVKLLLLINAVGYFMWKFNPDFMARHAALSLKNYKEGRPWSAFLHVFSHDTIQHLFSNMYFLVGVAPSILQSFGEDVFFKVITGTTLVIGPIILILDKIRVRLIRKNSKNRLEKTVELQNAPTIGFSGINSALAVLFCLKGSPIVTTHLLATMGLRYPLN